MEKHEALPSGNQKQGRVLKIPAQAPATTEGRILQAAQAAGASRSLLQLRALPGSPAVESEAHGSAVLHAVVARAEPAEGAGVPLLLDRFPVVSQAADAVVS